MILTDLKNRHKDATIYVIGSGGSLGYIKPDFFTDKISIAVNYAGRVHGFSPTYLYSHYYEDIEINLDDSSIGITLELNFRTKEKWQGEIPNNLCFSPVINIEPPGNNWDPYVNPVAEDGLVFGSSSIHGAMHLGAYLGAKYLILVGVDCGTLDGQERIENYPAGQNPWATYEEHNRKLKAWLKERYEIDIYSLNPFINLNLEGHSFTGV